MAHIGAHCGHNLVQLGITWHKVSRGQMDKAHPKYAKVKIIKFFVIVYSFRDMGVTPTAPCGPLCVLVPPPLTRPYMRICSVWQDWHT